MNTWTLSLAQLHWVFFLLSSGDTYMYAVDYSCYGRLAGILNVSPIFFFAIVYIYIK